MKETKCKEHKCGKFKGGESKEAKLKHLKECKQNLMKKIEEIDATIREI